MKVVAQFEYTADNDPSGSLLWQRAIFYPHSSEVF
jgi:hypothetical protein